MPFLGIPTRRDELPSASARFRGCIKVSESADRLGIAIPLMRRNIQSLVYATSGTFPPDTFCVYRRRLGLSNVSVTPSTSVRATRNVVENFHDISW